MVVERIGQQFGSYRLLRFLGQGGFAEVYLGEHIHLGSLVAVKVLHTRLIAHQQEQFLREARTISSLDHPGIVRILDCGVEHGVPFLVMTYAPQGSLRQLYPEGTRLSIADILAYVRPVASVLAYAHEHKLIHRDIKPENILLGDEQEVLLSDFGIAVVSSSTTSPDTKEIAGTIAYMAPEQIMGKPRATSDQYALGVVVYEWLCGELPFSGTFLETCTQHLYAPPPSLREKIPTLSQALENVVFKALAKDPQQRFASIQEFADALEECVKPSVSHHYSTIRMPSSELFASSFKGEARKTAVPTHRGLFWLFITSLCLLIMLLSILTPTIRQRIATSKAPALISLAAHTYQQPSIRSQQATALPSTTTLPVPTPVLPTVTPEAHLTQTKTPATISAVVATATPTHSRPKEVVSNAVVSNPVPTVAPAPPASPTLEASLQLQVSPTSLTPQECSQNPGFWECNVTLTASGSGTERLRWSMALSENKAGMTTPMLHGHLAIGENRSITVYIPNDPFGDSCVSASLIFSSSTNTVTVPWDCP